MATIRSEGVITSMNSVLRPKDISNEIFNMRPANTPFLTLLMGLKKVTVDDYEFKMNVQEMDPGWVTATAVDGGAGTITVSTDDAKYIKIGQTLRLDHTTTTLVTAVNYSTGVLTVSSTSGITATKKLILGGAGAEELSTRPTPITRTPDVITNYVETQRDAWGQSRHAQNTRFYGGPRQFHNREHCLWEHKRALNRGLLLNVGTETTQNSQKLFKTSGLLSQITTNITDFTSGGLSWDAVRQALTSHTRFVRSRTLWLIVSRKGHELLERMLRNDTTPNDYAVTQVVSFRWFEAAGYRINILVEDAFEYDLEDTMILADPDAIEIVTTADKQGGARQWMLERTWKPEDRDDGTDGTVGELMTDYGLRLNGQKRCAVWHGVAALAS